ncbi:MAG: EAL domain-containing protein [Gammaproteobacteria bacterium]|nr:EAL domain-containing protein [Gammaproteobacteria bacterium]MCH9744410.1 EAL domain-containing protein [Gammaproteobacteria bacterium]
MNREDRLPNEVSVLVVDDNPKNIVAMKNILSDLPITIHTASSGAEALKMVLRSHYAVIFLDVQMPEMDGYEVATCLMQNKETANIPIIFVTAINDSDSNILEGYKSGAIDYLTKPINPQILVAKTKIFIRLSEQQEALSSAVKQLDELANNDSLTGLANRHQFNLFFEKLLANSKRYQREFALLLLDLDNFKLVNDNFGHNVGDQLLQVVSKCLQEHLRASDLIARLGGDEFVILLSELDVARNAGHVAENIARILSEPITIDGHKINTSVSIGIATYPFASDSVEGLFKAADIALYRAKDAGKSMFQYFTDSLNQEYMRRSKVEAALQKAVENESITLSYQPRVNIQTGEIVGLEALARWHDDELGNVSPAEFIAVAEEMGYISLLGKYLIRNAFKAFCDWQQKFKHLKFSLSINLSPYQFLNPMFVESLKELVHEHAIDLDRLEFELTESVFKGNHEELETLLQNVCDMGVRFSIDDFGTGYSSLSRLKTLPICVLKIDQSFVRDITSDPNDAAIVQAVIALAEALDLGVVAEGVETKAQADFLQKNGCQEAQGFYYSKAISADAMGVLLEKGGVDTD